MKLLLLLAAAVALAYAVTPEVASECVQLPPTVITTCESEKEKDLSTCKATLSDCLNKLYESNTCTACFGESAGSNSGKGRKRTSASDEQKNSGWSTTDCQCTCSCMNEYYDCFNGACDNATAAIQSVPKEQAPWYVPNMCSGWSEKTCYFQMWGDPHMRSLSEKNENHDWLCMSDTSFPNLYDGKKFDVSAEASTPSTFQATVTYLRSITVAIPNKGSFMIDANKFKWSPATAPSGFKFGTCNRSIQMGAVPCATLTITNAETAGEAEFIRVFQIVDKHLDNYLDLELQGNCDGTGTFQKHDCPSGYKGRRSTLEAARESRAAANPACAGLAPPYTAACNFDMAQGESGASSSELAMSNVGRIVNLKAALASAAAAAGGSGAALGAGAIAGIVIGATVGGVALLGAAAGTGYVVGKKRQETPEYAPAQPAAELGSRAPRGAGPNVMDPQPGHSSITNRSAPLC